MTKDRFDNIIKDKMESMRMESDSNAWEDFSKRLDSELGPEYEKAIDNQLDAEVQSKMNDLTVSFQSSHWLLLKERLETQALYIQNLYSSKAFELVIFLLLLITFAQQLPNPVQFEFDKNKIYTLDNSLQKINLANVQPLQKIQTPKRNKSIAGTNFSIAISTQNTAQEIKNVKKKLISSNSDSPEQNANQHFDAFTQHGQSNHNTLAYNNIPTVANIAPLATLTSTLDHSETQLKPTFVNINPAFNAKKKTDGETWLTMHASVDNNLINTPINHVYKTAPYSKFAAGLSGGISYDIKADGIELGTGLSYSSVLYDPQEVTVITGGLNELNEYSLKNISFTYITVPMNLKFYIAEIGSWSGFAHLGFGLNSILTASYADTSTEPREKINKPSTPPPAPPIRGFEPLVKTNPKGLLQGGSFGENLFVQASVGLGIQKNFSENMGLYAALSYSNHFINSIGPNDDTLDKTSLTIGARYRL